jgi:phage host-nuclease inhibitor protein Gam
MAPARTAKNTSAADAVISSPVSLLWAHQLRREHSVLLTRIEDLVAIVNNISPTQISTLQSRVQFTESQMKEHNEHQEEKHKNIDEQISKLREDLNTRAQVAKEDGAEVKAQLQTLGENLAAVEKRQQEDCNERHTDLKQELEWQTKKFQDSVEALIARVAAFEARPQDGLQETVNVVKDSMEIMKEHMKALGKPKFLILRRYSPADSLSRL